MSQHPQPADRHSSATGPNTPPHTDDAASNDDATEPSMPDPALAGSVLAGVTHGQCDQVVREAVRLARQFDVSLVCAYVDGSGLAVGMGPDGSLSAIPIDPDLPEWTPPEFDPDLAARITELTRTCGVRVENRAIAGDPATGLADLAATLNARYIVVGSRARGFGASIREFFAGSVAVYLAHHQHRPVVVVPQAPVKPGASVPWDEPER